MANYTLTYSEGSKGFPSFYSYFPEYMIGMNNYLYSFNKGQLYRHNTNATRNSYYGVTYSSFIKTVINQSPLENKLFKTLNLQSTDAWGVEVLTDISSQQSTIDSTSFEKKEGSYFSYIRTNGVSSASTTLTEADYKSRTVGGLGNIVGGAAGAGSIFVRFSESNWDGMVSIGDLLYKVSAGDTTATFVAVITDITFDSSTNRYEVVAGPYSGPLPSVNDFYLYAKNSVAESLGVMGHYAEIKLTLPKTVETASELFAIESDLMKSYP